ncbi:hypothetical protein JK188_12245 [Providencia sp. JGM181]|jgi:hypothetical protein|uniref:hypothetical protein n=1 Tax=unclassified Providencia TaxID=2633465 RepID=UPI001BAC9955|nr:MULTISPECIES: hypothetical protein [unclassified Providencia]MBS0925251.1 hypothetical protein [Providencia sp. JGM181]MBS0934011.1 hypothetical protein [Providencia sp. JGM172]MBS0999127.1 hypothetical protein [Providencia sp. JGM178]
MKLNNQKRWGKVWSAAAGLIIYNVFTAVSYSNTFPSNPEFKNLGLVWEGSEVSKSESMSGTNYIGGNIHGKVLSNIDGSSWGSVDGYYGVVLEPGVVFTLSGDSNAKAGSYEINVKYNNKSDPTAASRLYNLETTTNSGLYKYRAVFAEKYLYQQQSSQTQYFTATKLRASLYLSNSVKPNKTYSYNGEIWLEVGLMRIYLVKNPSFTFAPPIQCTINTPPKIDFGKVNIWDWEGNTTGTPGGARKDVLGVVDGNFTINCTGDNGAHAPAKLTLKGNTQGYTNDLKMTMDATGEVAPATIRASIKSLYPPCDSNGVNFGLTTGKPLAHIVDLGELTVGPHQVPYRFSLCALGEGFKSGAASATATVTLDWE